MLYWSAFFWWVLNRLFIEQCWSTGRHLRRETGRGCHFPLSGISGLSFDSPFLSPLLSFSIVLLLFLSCHFSANGPFSWLFPENSPANIFWLKVRLFGNVLFELLPSPPPPHLPSVAQLNRRLEQPACGDCLVTTLASFQSRRLSWCH